jgi:outer membrane protein TolC
LTYDIGSFLWIGNNQPFDLANLNLVPTNEELLLNNQINTSINNNPKLLSYGFKLKDLEIQKRLKAESLRPTIDLQLGLINSGNNAFRNINTNYWANNNKIGVQFSFPLTFSTARGDLAETKIKIADTQFEQSLVENDLKVKFNQNNAESLTLQQQYSVLQQSVKASELLLNGEEIKFKFGDSSLFLINSRELKLIEVKEKLLSIENKIAKNKLKADWIVGGLSN